MIKFHKHWLVPTFENPFLVVSKSQGAESHSLGSEEDLE